MKFVPAVVRAHGLRDAHPFPLVSPGKRPDGSVWTFRRPPAYAWGFPEIELHTHSAWTVIALDIDGFTAHRRLGRAMEEGNLPQTNWNVERYG